MLNVVKCAFAVAAVFLLCPPAQAGPAQKCCRCETNFQPMRCHPVKPRIVGSNLNIRRHRCSKPIGSCQRCDPDFRCCRITTDSGILTASGVSEKPVHEQLANGQLANGDSIENVSEDDDEVEVVHSTPSPLNCDGSCCSTGVPCKLAELIHESQTASRFQRRRFALSRISSRYDCCCHPQIMDAFVYAMRDSHPKVRSKAADAIGDQLRANPGCCTNGILSALTYALNDCDHFVRLQAEQGLRAAGYRVVDGRCVPWNGHMAVAYDVTPCNSNGCCPTGCSPPAFETSAPDPSRGIPPEDATAGNNTPNREVKNPDFIPASGVAPPPVDGVVPASSSQPNGNEYFPDPDAPVPGGPSKSRKPVPSSQDEESRFPQRLFGQNNRRTPIRTSLRELFSQSK